jgi:hypothetical protein
MRREAPPHARLRRRPAQVRARGRTGPRAASRGAVDHAEERPHRELEPDCVPLPQLLPGPLVHADLAPAAALAAADEQRAAATVEVCLAERESLVDSQPGSLEHDDQRPQAMAVCSLAGGAHPR